MKLNKQTFQELIAQLRTIVCSYWDNSPRLNKSINQATTKWQNSKFGPVINKQASTGWKLFSQLKLSIRIVIALVVISSMWILSGYIFPHKQLEQEHARGKQSEYKVITSNGVQYQQSLRLAATTEAAKQVPLKAETDAKVTAIIAKEGQFLKAGEPIVQLEVQNKNESLERAQAGLKQARIDYQATNALYAKKLSSDSEMAQVTAKLKSAEADYKQAQLNWNQTMVKAPFDGVIDKILVNVGDYMQTLQGNSIIGTFMTRDAMLAVAWVSEHDASLLHEGLSVQVEQDDGNNLPGIVKFVASIANAQTHAFRVDVSVNNSTINPLLSGQTVTISIPTREVVAHKLPASALTIDMNGTLGIKAVDTNGNIKTMPVQIVGEEEGQMWLTGLPQTAQVIVLGHNYLLDGDHIDLPKPQTDH